MLDVNIIIDSDSYKYTHPFQYPPGTQYVYDYFEPRSEAVFDETLLFGLQYYRDTRLKPLITKEKIDEAEDIIANQFGTKKMFPRALWEAVITRHDGVLPVELSSLPEGLPVPRRTPLITLVNTDPEFWWLPCFLETSMVRVWSPTTVVSQGRVWKRMILKHLIKTGDPTTINYKFHCFGSRGVSSGETAAWAGAGHLVNWYGTDTVSALKLCRDFYGEESAGVSVPAAEHSTIISWGKSGEVEAFRNMIRLFGSKENNPTGFYAMPIDSYDAHYACDVLLGQILKDEILAADNVLVARPDSGEPTQIVPELMKILMNRFGYIGNSKGYDVLNPKIRMLQGDGINLPKTKEIIEVLEREKLSGDNLTYGCGGANLQRIHRDTQHMAFKPSEVTIAGEAIAVKKTPVTDPSKASQSGRFCVRFKYHLPQLKLNQNECGTRNVITEPLTPENKKYNLLQTRYYNGSCDFQSLAEIRDRALVGLL